MKGFVVGNPRSGTMFVSQLLSVARAGVCGHEVLIELAPALISRATEWYEGRCQPKAVLKLFDEYQRSSAEIDSNWKLSWVLPLLLEQFPDVGVVHLIRDPRTNVRSFVELGYYSGLAGNPCFPASDRLREWLCTMPRLPRTDWHRLDDLERCCAFWNETHQLIESALEGHPRVLNIRVEDLASDSQVQRLIEFFSLPMPSTEALVELRASMINSKVNDKRDVAFLRPLVWSAKHERRVWQWCGQIARWYGYH